MPGDRVLVLLGPTPAWPAVLLGALKAGFVAVPCPEAMSNDELERGSGSPVLGSSSSISGGAATL